jgi:uncharacterized membrane protein
MGGLIGLLLSVALATMVEVVEALTVVLAIGVTRGWRATWQGVGAGVAVLAVVIAALGPALNQIPIDSLRLIVGGLLLVFGLQWLRKAILRASGHKALHDEDALYAAQVTRASQAATTRRFSVGDWYAFTVVCKAVVLEGLEVAFIVVTFGVNAGHTSAAVLAALVAIVVVSLAGAAVRAPLARVPENAMKFVVGAMLTSFGMFWAGEGAGVTWPGGDAAILGLLAFTAAIALISVRLLRGVTTESEVSSV